MLGVNILRKGKHICSQIEATNDIQEGIKLYAEIKMISRQFSDQFENIMLVFYLVHLFYFTTTLDPETWNSIELSLSFIGFICIGPIIWIASAELFCIVGRTIQKWFEKVQSFDVQPETDTSIMKSIMMADFRTDCLMNPVGISCRFFTITYQFIGSVRVTLELIKNYRNFSMRI